MGIEEYTPTPEELADAEDYLTPEQKIQSEAHEEGYKLGEERNKNVLHFELDESNELNKIQKIIYLDIRYDNVNTFEVGLNKVCLLNNVTLTLRNLSYGKAITYKYEVKFEGTKENILKVIEAIEGR